MEITPKPNFYVAACLISTLNLNRIHIYNQMKFNTVLNDSMDVMEYSVDLQQYVQSIRSGSKGFIVCEHKHTVMIT